MAQSIFLLEIQSHRCDIKLESRFVTELVLFRSMFLLTQMRLSWAISSNDKDFSWWKLNAKSAAFPGYCDRQLRERYKSKSHTFIGGLAPLSSCKKY